MNGHSQQVDAFSRSTTTTFHAQIQIVLTRDLGYSSEFAAQVSQKIWQILLEDQRMGFDKISEMLSSTGIQARWNTTFAQKRSRYLADWFRPRVVGTLLDLLCGDGKIGERIGDFGVKVALMEREGVYDCDRTLHTVPYQDIRSETYFKTSPVSQFDTVLLSTVLHHEADSNLILSSAAKLSRLRIIVLENCIEDDYPEDYQQFVDLFFNECLNHTKLESPMSHRSVQEWEKTLSKYGELIAVEKRTDVPGIPLSHHMFVIEVKNSNGNV